MGWVLSMFVSYHIFLIHNNVNATDTLVVEIILIYLIIGSLTYTKDDFLGRVIMSKYYRVHVPSFIQTKGPRLPRLVFCLVLGLQN